MRSVLTAIRPNYCELIANGKKTIIVQKTRPKLETPFRDYIYCTGNKSGNDKLWVIEKGFRRYVSKEHIAHIVNAKNVGGTYLGNSKVIGEFVCDRIDKYNTEFYAEDDIYQEIRRVWLDADYDYPYEDFEIIASNDAENFDDNKLLKDTCLTLDELKKYVDYGDKFFYGWHISDLKIYDKPKEIVEFYTRKKCTSCNDSGYESAACIFDEECIVPEQITRPPQSWCYVEA